MDTLKSLRMTCQRQIILEELAKTKTHPTADEVYQFVRRRLPRISLGTVYRNLDILSRCGRVRKLELGGSQRRFDGNVEAHYHIRCRQCGKMSDVSMEPLTDLEAQAARKSDYRILGHQLEFLGLCPLCQSLAK